VLLQTEIIVPVGMTPLQKEIYKATLFRNYKLLRTITGGNGAGNSAKSIVRSSSSSSGYMSLTNVLMELRKCLNHPYLLDGIEPDNLDLAEAHQRMIDASAKLQLLHFMLPELRSRGHRVLLFSQMSRLLDIVEDYLAVEQYKYLRLDGSTPGEVRQELVDKFNAPGSDIFAFLLTTRAGGIGLNLGTVAVFGLCGAWICEQMQCVCVQHLPTRSSSTTQTSIRTRTCRR
jgi:SNF2 family DNA or RNA helicase